MPRALIWSVAKIWNIGVLPPALEGFRFGRQALVFSNKLGKSNGIRLMDLPESAPTSVNSHMFMPIHITCYKRKCNFDHSP